MSSLRPIPETLERVDQALRRAGRSAENEAWGLLECVNEEEASVAALRKLKADVRIPTDELERVLLWYATQQALNRTTALPVVSSVRTRLEQDLFNLPATGNSLEVCSYAFNRAAKLATLRRFPAGPMEWEVSGIPRSYFLQAKFPANVRLLTFAVLRLRGLGPCFFMHVAPAPRNRALSIPKEVLRSYYRIIRSLELQPEIRGLLAHAWFHDPAAVRDSPQLEVLNRPYLDHGGLITLLAPAPPSSGVVVGSAQRRADYEAGRIQYHYGFAVWPRAAALRWAHDHKELDD